MANLPSRGSHPSDWPTVPGRVKCSAFSHTGDQRDTRVQGPGDRVITIITRLQSEVAELSEQAFVGLATKETETIGPLFRQAVIGTQNLMRKLNERQAELDPKPTGEPALRIEIRQFYLGMSMRQAIERLLGRADFDELEAVIERIELFGWPPEVVQRIRDKYRLLNEIRVHKIHVPLRPSLDKIAVVGSDLNAELAQARARLGQVFSDREPLSWRKPFFKTSCVSWPA